ncbi:hypothetical protein ABH19_04555 [Leptospirillum sp. Group II 'CF-1']|nr:hypothetical protein ABH19_04555 [Leptospirillum sp. Group II 'CF-1']
MQGYPGNVPYFYFLMDFSGLFRESDPVAPCEVFPRDTLLRGSVKNSQGRERKTNMTGIIQQKRVYPGVLPDGNVLPLLPVLHRRPDLSSDTN